MKYTSRPSRNILDIVLQQANGAEKLKQITTVNLKAQIESFMNSPVSSYNNVANDLYWRVLSAAVTEFYKDPDTKTQVTSVRPWLDNMNLPKKQQPVQSIDFFLSLSGQLSLLKDFSNYIP
jgi:hypothetical protein